MNRKLVFGVIASLAVGLLAILVIVPGLVQGDLGIFTGRITSALTGNSDNPDSSGSSQSCHYEREPYETEETYTVTEPYETTEGYDYYPNYRVTDTTFNSRGLSFDRGIYAKGTVTVKNVDSESTWFTVEYTFRTVEGKLPIQRERHYIEPDEEKTYEFTYDKDLGEDIKMDSYDVEADPITKTRTVTKEREVTKTRTVTKYREVKKCD